MRTISTPLTFFFKYFELPLKVIAVTFLIVLSIKTGELIFGVVLLVLLVWGTIESFKINLKLKRVYLNDTTVTVDNFSRSITIALTEIESIKLKMKIIGVITLRTPTEFGQTIYFLPRYWDIVDIYTSSLVKFGENNFEFLKERVEKTC